MFHVPTTLLGQEIQEIALAWEATVYPPPNKPTQHPREGEGGRRCRAVWLLPPPPVRHMRCYDTAAHSLILTTSGDVTQINSETRGWPVPQPRSGRVLHIVLHLRLYLCLYVCPSLPFSFPLFSARPSPSLSLCLPPPAPARPPLSLSLSLACCSTTASLSVSSRICSSAALMSCSIAFVSDSSSACRRAQSRYLLAFIVRTFVFSRFND